MGTEKVTARILEEAKKEASEIKKEAEEKAAHISEDAHLKAKEIEKKNREQAKKLFKEEKSKILALSKMHMRNEILKEKTVIIDEAFKRSIESLVNRPKKEYQTIIRNLILKSCEVGDEEVIIVKKDRDKLDTKFLSKINKEIKKAGKKGTLQFSNEGGNFSGGVILRKGNVEMNATFETLLEGTRDELEMELAKILFK